MKRVPAILAVILAATALTSACVSIPAKCIQGNIPDCPGPQGASTDAAAATDAGTAFPPPSMPNSGPQLVIPATGGAPIIGIPVGADLFIPATGGPPVVGISTDP
jgi:hypothetical protein